MAVTTTVVPGYTLQDGETVTTAKLNLLGRPSISVNGALDGSTPVTIGMDSIRGENLIGSGTNAVCDEITIERDATTKKLKVKDLGVSAAKLAGTLDLTGKNVTLPVGSVITDSVAANAITFGKLDANFIADATEETPDKADLILFGDASDSNNSKWAKIAAILTAGRFTATATGTLASGVTSFTHGLSAVPGRVRVVLVCQSTHTSDGATWTANDELDVTGLLATTTLSSAPLSPAATIKCNATTVAVTVYTTAVRAVTAAATLKLLDNSKWKLKVYAEV